MSKPLLPALAATLVLAAGCGEDPEPKFSPEEEKAIEAIVGSISDADASEQAKKQARCTAEGLVESQGVDKLQRAGLLTEKLESRVNQVKVDQETAIAIGDAYIACLDIPTTVADARAANPSVPAEAWTAYQTCLEGLKPAMRASVIEFHTAGGGQTAQQALVTQTHRCNQPLAQYGR